MNIKKIGIILMLIVTAYAAGRLLMSGEINRYLKTEITNDILFDLTNKTRNEFSLPSLNQNLKLTEAAQNKADDMAARGYFAHTDPDGRRFTYWITEAGYEYLYAGENLAVKFKTSEKIIEKWMESLTHKANLLGERYTDIGIGVAEGFYKGKKTIFVVQMFGEPTIPYNRILESKSKLELWSLL